MIVKMARPPLFDEINAAFHIEGQPVIFAWGDTIYNPMGGPVSDALQAHEAVHGARQGSDVEGWWRRYIVEPDFRLDEEIPAHQAEYRQFCRDPRRSRADRRMYLHRVAKCLAAPLYGRLISYDAARKLIKQAA